MTNLPTIFIIDDDPDMCKSLSFLLESVQLPIEIYHSGAAYLEVHDSNRHGCLLIDMRMPGMSGLQLIDQLNTRQNPLPVIIISAHGDIPLAVRAMKAGAVDFISKPFNEQLLVERIQELIEKDRRRHTFTNQISLHTQRFETLTSREREVLEEVVRGKLNKQIAYALGISMKTVEQHRARLMAKMQADSLAELVKTYWLLEGSNRIA